MTRPATRGRRSNERAAGPEALAASILVVTALIALAIVVYRRGDARASAVGPERTMNDAHGAAVDGAAVDAIANVESRDSATRSPEARSGSPSLGAAARDTSFDSTASAGASPASYATDPETATVRITGIVTDPEGRPLELAWVAKAGTSIETPTRPDGSFELVLCDETAPALIELTAQHLRHPETLYRTLEARATDSGRDIRIEVGELRFEARTGSVVGRVVDRNGAAAPGIRLRLVRAGAAIPPADIGADDPLDEIELRRALEREGLDLDAVLAATARQDPAVDRLLAGGRDLAQSDREVRYATTDSRGTFRFEATPEGPYELDAVTHSLETERPSVTVRTDATIDVGTMVLAPGLFTLEGLVLDEPTGAPVEGATITLGPYRAVSDVAGSFRMTGDRPGPFQLLARAPTDGDDDAPRIAILHDVYLAPMREDPAQPSGAGFTSARILWLRATVP